MQDIINITDARNNLSQVIKDVVKQKKSYILLRDSKPQAVIISYDEYLSQEQDWQQQVGQLMDKGQKTFGNWLKKAKIKAPENEKELYKIIDKTADRY